MDHRPENQKKTWFWKWFLDNQLVTGLLILLLLLVNLILFSQTSYLFNPIKGIHLCCWGARCLRRGSLLLSKNPFMIF